MFKQNQFFVLKFNKLKTKINNWVKLYYSINHFNIIYVKKKFQYWWHLNRQCYFNYYFLIDMYIYACIDLNSHPFDRDNSNCCCRCCRLMVPSPRSMRLMFFYIQTCFHNHRKYRSITAYGGDCGALCEHLNIYTHAHELFVMYNTHTRA